MSCKARFIILAVGFLWIAVDHTHSTRAHRSGFDQPCNKALRCESQSWFSCDQETGKCRCAKSDEMVYDSIEEKCISLIGERCKFGFDDDDDYEELYEQADCVEGAECGPSGTCSCQDGHYENVETNQCLPVKDYGQLCSNEHECNQGKLLNCVQGQCKCDPDNAVYNTMTFDHHDDSYRHIIVPSWICVGRVGTSCSYNSDPIRYCVENSGCDSSGICRCSAEYSETLNRLCGLGYDQPCSECNVCSDKLQCLGFQEEEGSDTWVHKMTCQCPHPKYQSYDTTLKICRGTVGAPCVPNDRLSCVDKASCIERDNIFQCECHEDFIETLTGGCQIAHGASCDYTQVEDAEIPIPQTNFCDSFADLKCKDGICSCGNGVDVYESDRRKCLSPVGIRCDDTAECISNSECVKLPITNNFPGRCTCKEGFVTTKHHTCEIPVPMTVEDSTEDENDYESIHQNNTVINN